MSDADLDRLEGLANAATPGPWEFMGLGSTFMVRRVGSGWGRVVRGDLDEYGQPDDPMPCGGVVEWADAAFIAACDPGTIKALIAELRKQRLLAAGLCGAAERVGDFYAGPPTV